MKRFLLILLSLLCLAADKSPQEKYIEKYSGIAVSEMARSGVPASITLAQGLVESRAGLAPLAAKGNNHFGIKCHSDWKGRKMYQDDDAKGECFRVYATAELSFRDHSDFLRYKDRYKSLFDLKPTDYKGWAHGLKKAGYATDPKYASKLIKVIEDYELYRFDRGGRVAKAEKTAKAEKAGRAGNGSRDDKAGRGKRGGRKDTGDSAGSVSCEEDAVPVPESPLAIEAPRKVDPDKYRQDYNEEFCFNLSRNVMTRNGVPFVTSLRGESYASIAATYGLFLKELLAFNDLKSEEELKEGTIVYIQKKKKNTGKDLDKYIVDHDGEDLREISQRFGVRLSSINKLNGFASGHTVREGDTILLR